APTSTVTALMTNGTKAIASAPQNTIEPRFLSPGSAPFSTRVLGFFTGCLQAVGRSWTHSIDRRRYDGGRTAARSALLRGGRGRGPGRSLGLRGDDAQAGVARLAVRGTR